MNYQTEVFTDTEKDVLRHYVTNLDKPVFALVNLPEVVKGALFARYSRSNKSVRRLLLDEFIDDLDTVDTIGSSVGETRAKKLYNRVFVEYGDDSVAQLGSVHLACEQASNLLTKVLERGRLMSYLEQSTRYLAYNKRHQGSYRYYRPSEIIVSDIGVNYIEGINQIFDIYGEILPAMQAYFTTLMSENEGDSDMALKRTINAKAFDAVRGLLPAATLSNLGIFGSGQGYEALLLRMKAHPLKEARDYSQLMLTELRKVIPSFLERVDKPDRGGVWTEYLHNNQKSMSEFVDSFFGDVENNVISPEVKLLDWDPAGEDKILAAMLFEYSDLSESRLETEVANMTDSQRSEILRRYVGERSNRRHKPGRALERTDYRFEVVGDYGSFRDLQRHRLLTIEWQSLTPHHGYDIPDHVAAAGEESSYKKALDVSAKLYDKIEEQFAESTASYVVSMAYKIRYIMQFNAREAMHMIELRTQPQGHADYRRICQEMKRQIEKIAGHKTVASMLSFAVDGTAEEGRLLSERNTNARSC